MTITTPEELSACLGIPKHRYMWCYIFSWLPNLKDDCGEKMGSLRLKRIALSIGAICQSRLRVEGDACFHCHCTSTLGRLEICQEIYTTKFSGERILHTENA